MDAETRRSYMREYRAKNRERINELKREAYRRNPEGHKAKNQRWRSENPDRYATLQTQYRERNLDATLERSRQWYRDNKDRAAATQRRNKLKRYGLTVTAFEALVAAQMGQCAICGIVPQDRMVVDHCHETGKVRGLLCRPCNAGLGIFRDSPSILEAAIAYLRNSSSGVTSMPSNEP